MQQVMDMVQGLQEAMAASKVEQERMQAYLAASQARKDELCRTNEELHRTNEELCSRWRNNLGQRDMNEPAQFTPPRGFSAPLSQPNLGTRTQRGMVMVVERPPISDTPMEAATPAESTFVDATPAGRRLEKICGQRKDAAMPRRCKRYPRGARPWRK